MERTYLCAIISKSRNTHSPIFGVICVLVILHPFTFDAIRPNFDAIQIAKQQPHHNTLLLWTYLL